MADQRRMGGRYTLGEALGDGENTVVYRAVDTRGAQRVVATKVLHANGAPDPVQRQHLRDERDVLEQLDHPNVVQMLDAGTNGSTDWIVLDYATAGDLAEVLRLDGPFDEEAVLQIAIQLFAALESAHRVGILHHAIRPANLLIGHRGRILLSGFTHAKRYGAPCHDAVVRGRPSDLYDAACTLVHLLNGRHPEDLETFSLNDSRWVDVPDWMRLTLRGAAGAPDARPVDTAQAFALALLEGAHQYQRPGAEALAAMWSEIRPPQTLVQECTVPAPQQEAEEAGIPAVFLSIAGGLLVGTALIGLAAMFVL